MPVVTEDVDPAVDREDRIELFKRVIDRKRAEIEHLENTKRGLVTAIAEEKVYLLELKAELKKLKQEAKSA